MYFEYVQRRRSFTSDSVAADYQEQLSADELRDADFFYRLHAYFTRSTDYRRSLKRFTREYMLPFADLPETDKVHLGTIQFAPPRGMVRDVYLPVAWLSHFDVSTESLRAPLTSFVEAWLDVVSVDAVEDKVSTRKQLINHLRSLSLELKQNT